MEEVRLVKLEKGMVIHIEDYLKRSIIGRVKLGGLLYFKNYSNDCRLYTSKLYTYGNNDENKFLIIRKYNLWERIKLLKGKKFSFKLLFKVIYANIIDIEYIGV